MLLQSYTLSKSLSRNLSVSYAQLHQVLHMISSAVPADLLVCCLQDPPHHSPRDVAGSQSSNQEMMTASQMSGSRISQKQNESQGKLRQNSLTTHHGELPKQEHCLVTSFGHGARVTRHVKLRLE